MAFNQPIEADRPDDLGFLSAFVRAPVIGTLMWIIGGDMAKQLDEEEKVKEESSEGKITSINEDQQGETEIAKQTLDDSLEKKYNEITSVPDRISSEVSESEEPGDCSSFVPSLLQKHEGKRLSKKVRASWSDQSGQSLVEYLDGTTSREPPSTAQPVKSAMRRSRSIHSNSQISNTNPSNNRSGSNNQSQHRYIPSGINMGGAGGGIVMPSGGGMKTTNNGYVSPQWGWYVSTTPPQAEMYGRKSSDKKHDPAVCNPVNISADEIQVQMKAATISTPQPVFTKEIGAANTGWPSVPL